MKQSLETETETEADTTHLQYYQLSYKVGGEYVFIHPSELSNNIPLARAQEYSLKYFTQVNKYNIPRLMSYDNDGILEYCFKTTNLDLPLPFIYILKSHDW